MLSRRSILVFTFFALFWLGIAAFDCTFYDNQTDLDYDLTPLVVAPDAAASAFYSFNATTNEYYMNICEALNTEVLPCDIDSGSAVCQSEFANNSSFSCGEADTMAFSPYTGETSENNQGVQLIYKSGDYCYSLGTNRTTIINIGCNSQEIAIIESVEEEDCVYNVQMWSMYGCGSNTVPSPSGSLTMTTTPSASVSLSFAPSPSIAPSMSSSNSNSISITRSKSISRSRLASTATSGSISVSPTQIASNSPPVLLVSASSSISNSMSGTTLPSVPVEQSSSATISKTNSVSHSPSVSAIEPSSGTPAWIWYVMVAVVIAALIGAAFIAALVIYQKKRQESSYSQLSFE